VGAAIGAGALALAAILFVFPGQKAAPKGAKSPVAVTKPTPTSSPTPSHTPSHTPSPVAHRLASASDIKVRTVAYGSGARQRMDVWWHTKGPRRPAVFVIHGGWWSGGDKKTMTTVSRTYARLGYTVVNLDYRLSGDAPWPAQRTDTIAAIAAARAHADRYNTDPDRYVLIGFSAGGHIAAAVGTYGNGLPGLRGVVGVSPVVSPLTSYADGGTGGSHEQRKLRRTATELAGGCAPSECPDIWASMEVSDHASAGDAPMLDVHSQDEFVPPYQSELLQQALKTYGVPMSIKVMPGTQHSAPLYREKGVAKTVEDWIAARLESEK
jgi:acetyl esterase/lipase